MKFPRLFNKGQIGNLHLKNHLFMAAMVRDYADEHGRVTPRYEAHIERIARGGVGGLILEASFVRSDGRGFTHQLGLHHDDCIDGLKRLVEIAHKHHAVIGPQLYHAGRQTTSTITGTTPLAPSPIADPMMQETPDELTTDRIEGIVRDFAAAAGRAQKAGADFVEVHGAHGYLIAQFLSPLTNKRKDQYGGSDVKRKAFLLEIVRAIRAQVGPDFPVIVRLSGEEAIEGGLVNSYVRTVARTLEEEGIDAVHISADNYATYTEGRMIAPMAQPDGLLVHLAERIKQAVRIPVITVGKIRTPQLAEEILESGRADFIAIGRSLLADPDWPRKAQNGHEDQINHCIACNQGCIGRLFEQKDVWCTVNPECSREQEFAEARPSKQRFLVIGGGPAGMEAAKVAAERGNEVHLYERQDHLGGQLIAAAAAPHRPGWRELREHLEHEMQRLGVKVHLGRDFSDQELDQIAPDVVVVATGAEPITLPVLGDKTVFARVVLEQHGDVPGKVIVAGGGCAGAQTAEYLVDKGHDVTIVEMMDQIAVDAPVAERALLLKRLQEKGVSLRTNTRIVDTHENEVVVEAEGKRQTIPADTVVACLGSKPNRDLAEHLKQVGRKPKVVGDAVDARKVTEAMLEGAMAALTV